MTEGGSSKRFISPFSPEEATEANMEIQERIVSSKPLYLALTQREVYLAKIQPNPAPPTNHMAIMPLEQNKLHSPVG